MRATPQPLVARPPQARRSKRFASLLALLFPSLPFPLDVLLVPFRYGRGVSGNRSDAAAAWPDAITCGMPTPS